MKKNLRNSLILALGLITTGVFAQDWNGDSRTRINMSGDNDQFSTDQRATVGVTWGDSDWGIHVSSDFNYTMGDGTNHTLSANVYEAYASANLFGYANMTMGRQALNYGSGVLIGSNDWAANRNTVDGMTFSIANDLLNVDLGIARSQDDTVLENSKNNMWINASKSGENWNMNLLYATSSIIEDGGDALDNTMMGLDVDYTMGQFTLGASYNASTLASNADAEATMTTVSADYAMNDDLGLSVSRTAYGKDVAFASYMGNDMMGSWMTSGNMGHLSPEDVAMTAGVSYSMGAISLGLDYTTCSNPRDGNDDWQRTAMDVSLGYSLNDNASLGLRYVTDEAEGMYDGADATSDQVKYMWLTLSVTP